MSLRRTTIIPVISTLIYAAGDAVGGLMDFTSLLRPAGHGTRAGRVVGVKILDDAGQAADLTLHLFEQTFGASADQAAFAVSDADALNAIGAVRVLAADYDDSTAYSLAHLSPSLPFEVPQAGTSLFGQLETQGTPTYGAVDDLHVTVTIEEG